MMSHEEICREYRTAKNPTKQIPILAELNATDKKTIIQILLERGEKVDGRLTKDAKKKGAVGKPELSAQPMEGDHTHTHTHTHTAGGASDPAQREYLTVGELIALLQELPSECRVCIGEGYMLGYAYTQGYNAISRESMKTVVLIGGESHV